MREKNVEKRRNWFISITFINMIAIVTYIHLTLVVKNRTMVLR